MNTNQPTRDSSIDPSVDQYTRSFLLHFDPKQWGPICNLFLVLVRKGYYNAEQIVGQLIYERANAAWNTHKPGISEWELAQYKRDSHIHKLLVEHEQEAYEMAEWACWWDGLSQQERNTYKNARSRPYIQEAMKGKAVTEGQRWKLKSLGYQGPVTDRAHASQIIEQLMGDQ